MASRCADLKVAELKQMCKDNKVKGYSKLKHAELVVECCEGFSSDLGASPKELQRGKEKEIVNKIETVKEFKAILKQKMLVASSWLDNFKKSTGNRFEFGDLDDRKTTVLHDPVYEERSSSYGFRTSRHVDYHKSRITTDPLSASGYISSNNGYVFYLSGNNLITCDFTSYGNAPCVSENGRKHFVRKTSSESKVPPSKLIARKYEKVTAPVSEWSNYKKMEFKKNSVKCMVTPEKCNSGSEDEMKALNTSIRSLELASNGMDALKTVINTEKKRIAEVEISIATKRQRARESLEEWKNI